MQLGFVMNYMINHIIDCFVDRPSPTVRALPEQGITL